MPFKIPFFDIWITSSEPKPKPPKEPKRWEIEFATKEGVEVGLARGLTRHLQMTHDLNDETVELFRKFLVRHNITLCYSKDKGIIARDNGILNNVKEAKIYVLDEMEMGEACIKLKSLADEELHRMEVNGDMRELDSVVRQKVEIATEENYRRGDLDRWIPGTLKFKDR